MAAEWRYKDGSGSIVGPMAAKALVALVDAKSIGPDTWVSRDGGDWIPASRVNGLFNRAGATAPFEPVAIQAPAKLPSGSQLAEENMEVIDSAEVDGLRVEILAYRQLTGGVDTYSAESLYFAHRVGARLKQVRITLEDSEVITEAGSLHFMHGRVAMSRSIGGFSGLGKAMVNKMITREAAVMPRYTGTGCLYLEPSFGHFLIYRLNGEELIADKGMFYCGQAGLDVGAAMQKNISSALFGGEGLFQTRIRGSGICVFESPVPADEIRVVDLKDETLQVDGDFALMRSGPIEFSVEKSSKGLLGTFASGEGLLQTFRGTGRVWLAPTQAVYQRMRRHGFSEKSAPGKSSHTAT